VGEEELEAEHRLAHRTDQDQALAVLLEEAVEGGREALRVWR
jgi:hypothetical protein